MRPIPLLLVTACVVAAAGCTLVVPQVPQPVAGGADATVKRPDAAPEPEPTGPVAPTKPGTRPLPVSTPWPARSPSTAATRTTTPG